ncbi:hypothetical protein SAMN05421548_1253 [Paraburkholderia lycopersici]|uniref:Uncharacterized protein n=1 Tax=Paraburkholderia lycopersici TaxID=416944 RepID=A0A1G6XDH6_9BURK|nr:hypothetical protein SAMN05421548_1253 [Paraburkholderia lycopersici]
MQQRIVNCTTLVWIGYFNSQKLWVSSIFLDQRCQLPNFFGHF